MPRDPFPLTMNEQGLMSVNDPLSLPQFWTESEWIWTKFTSWSILVRAMFVWLKLNNPLTVSHRCRSLSYPPPPTPLKGTVASDQIGLKVVCAANEGLVRIQYKCLVPIYVLPKMKLLFLNRIIMFCLPVPTLMYLEIYIFPGSVCLFCCRKICGPILGIYKSLQTNECWNWDWGRAIPRKGIYKWDFRCSVELARPSWA